MSSLRVVTRKDNSSYTQILFREFDVVKGRNVQSSLAFDDHEQALKWKKVLDKVGPEKTRDMLDAEDRAQGHTKRLEAVTIGDWCRTYAKGLTGIGAGTRKNYDAYIRNDIEPFMGALPLTALCSPADDETPLVQAWVLEMEDDGQAGKTIANKHGFFFAACKAAMKRRPPLLPFNPCEDTKLPDYHFEACFLEPEEFDIIYNTLPLRWRPMVSFLVTSGVRWSECTALKARDVKQIVGPDGEVAWTVRIAKAWKKTGSNSDERLGTPKSYKGIRTINVLEEVAAALDLSKPDALLFATKDGRRITGSMFHNHCWQPAMRAVKDTLGLKPRVHDLRHTCASWLINNGAELMDVKEHLGHDSITTTYNRYGHLDRRGGQRATTALAKAFVRTVVGKPVEEAG